MRRNSSGTARYSTVDAAFEAVVIEDIDDEEVQSAAVHDTLRHILFECAALQLARERWTADITERGGEWDLRHMFSNTEVFMSVIGFLRETRLFSLLAY